MSTIRTKKSKRYTTINNTVLYDAALSWKAKGLAAYLLSKPDDWRIQREHLAMQSTDGVSSVRSALQELAKMGYLVRQKSRNEQGKIAWEYVLHEEPQNRDPLLEKTEKKRKKGASPLAENQPMEPLAENPPVVFPPVVFPPVEKPPVENQPLYINTEYISTEDISTEDIKTENQPPSTIQDPVVPTMGGGGGKGFSGLALALIEKHFNGWNNAPAYVLNLTDGQTWALLTWLWVQHLLSEERTAADFETDRGLDTYAYREWQQQKADIEATYGALFAGVNNRIGLICKRVGEVCPARLLPIDEADLRAEVAHYGEEGA